TAGTIVFTSTRDGNEEIYAASADGSNQRNLTQNASADRQPALSPDVTRVAFVSDRDGRQDLYLMNADGTHQTRLTDGYYLAPDRPRLAFSVQGPAGAPSMASIFVSGADGSNPQQITPWGSFDSDPQSSADGTTILFQRFFGPGNPLEVFATTLDGRFLNPVV